jgi:hypothetical protein
VYTLSGIKIASRYTRIVIGGRGPYMEFLDTDIEKEKLYIPEPEKYRLSSSAVFFDEYRTLSQDNVKVYFQKKLVDYADYLIGFWYISPFLLKTESVLDIVSPMKQQENILE